jgi:Sulfotransferase family
LNLFLRLRASIRDRFFRFLHTALTHDAGREAVADSLRGLIDPSQSAVGLRTVAAPYDDLGRLNGRIRICDRDDVVFLTGRFRSGSTLLWNVFRQLEGCTCYYEPFNERQWFNPARRGERVDGSHRGVSDYWREYDGLEELGRQYREDWIRRGLYMDGRSWNPTMRAYLERLIERSQRRPVLQFNRIDFRLPWFRHNFPQAQIIHIYRHPRDQWCSSLLDITGFGPEGGNLSDFAAADRFYLRTWVNDLKYHFPFLADESLHPYRHFYWLWKLSYLYGVNYANDSLCFEDLVTHPQRELPRLFDRLGIEVQAWSAIESVVAPPEIGKWRKYADDGWFRRHEVECERVLADFLRGGLPTEMPRAIAATH